MTYDTNAVYDAPLDAVDSPPAPPPPTGKVHLYDWDEASGNWTELPLSPLKGDAAGDLFGYWLAMSDDGKTLSVGAPGRSDDEGYARVFTLGVETLSRIHAPPSPPVLVQAPPATWARQFFDDTTRTALHTFTDASVLGSLTTFQPDKSWTIVQRYTPGCGSGQAFKLGMASGSNWYWDSYIEIYQDSRSSLASKDNSGGSGHA